ncbi:antiterminator Q family protein [Acinetobacter baumannii]
MMNNKPHVLQACNWKKYTIENWLEQFGAWINEDSAETYLGTRNTLTYLIDSVEGVKRDARKRSLPQCKISTDEARAVSGLLRDLRMNPNPTLQEWLDFVVLYYVHGLSEETIADISKCSRNAVRQDLKCGIAYIVGQRNTLRSKLTEKQAKVRKPKKTLDLAPIVL